MFIDIVSIIWVAFVFHICSNLFACVYVCVSVCMSVFVFVIPNDNVVNVKMLTPCHKVEILAYLHVCRLDFFSLLHSPVLFHFLASLLSLLDQHKKIKKNKKLTHCMHSYVKTEVYIKKIIPTLYHVHIK